jgi:mono/diheme cytochrome c family protein
VLIPAVLFVTASAATFALAQLHPAKPSLPTSASVQLGDAYRGETVYAQNCAGCHGAAAEGGVGPKLAGAQISLASARSRIESGGGVMPANLVSGRDEEDVLAYLATIFDASG